MVGINDKISKQMERDPPRAGDCIPTAKTARETARRAKPEPDAPVAEKNRRKKIERYVAGRKMQISDEDQAIIDAISSARTPEEKMAAMRRAFESEGRSEVINNIEYAYPRWGVEPVFFGPENAGHLGYITDFGIHFIEACIAIIKNADKDADKETKKDAKDDVAIAAKHFVHEVINQTIGFEEIDRIEICRPWITPGTTIRDRPWKQMHEQTVHTVMFFIDHHTTPIAKRIEKVRGSGITAEEKMIIAAIHEMSGPEKMIAAMCMAFEQNGEPTNVAGSGRIPNPRWGYEKRKDPDNVDRPGRITAFGAEFVTACMHVIKVYDRPGGQYERYHAKIYSEFEEARNAAIYFVNQVIDRTIGMRIYGFEEAGIF